MKRSYSPHIIILFFILSVIINGCTEGIINHTPKTIDPSVAIVQLWKTENVYAGQKVLSEQYSKTFIKFYENGDYEIHNTINTETGKWSYKKADSALIMAGKSTTLAKVLEITEDKFRFEIELSIDMDSGTVFECSRVNDGFIYSLKGEIDTTGISNLPQKLYVSVFWELEKSPNAYFVWGHGSINRQKNEYCISFDEFPNQNSSSVQCLNMQMLTNSLDMSFYAVGRIVLHTDPTIHNSKYMPNISNFKNSSHFWGAVNDRHIVFVSNGGAELLKCKVKFPGFFDMGYNIGKRKQNIGPPDMIVPLDINDKNVLKVNKNWDSFVFAQWRPV